MLTLFSAFEEKLEISVDSGVRPSSAGAQTLFVFITPAVNTEVGRSALAVPGGLGSCSELGTHQGRERAAEAHLLHEQDPPRCRD